MYPINSQTPALSPPTPPEHVSPTETPSQGFPSSNHMSYSHPSAPPPLTSLPPRQTSDQSQIIVTPSDVGQQLPGSSVVEVGGAPLDEPLVIDPALANAGPTSARTSHSSGDNSSYFDGVVGLKQDGTALIERSGSNGSPYSRYPPQSPQTSVHHHPYRRPNLPSPGKSQSSPTSLAPDGKPVFAMPFNPSSHPYQQHEGLLAPPLESGVKMERQGSQASESGDASWQPQRW
jgi:hypothetical protein